MELLGRLRSDRVMQLPAPPRQPGTHGRPRKHGRELALADPATWPAPQVTTSTATSRYGMARAAAWDRVHPRLTHRAAWLDHDGAAAGHRGNPDPAAGGSPARRPRPQARVAVVLSAPAPLPARWTGCGRRSCAASTWSTPSGCSSRSSGGPPRRSATRRRGPVDLADHHLPRPAPPRPAAGRGPAPPLGTARSAGPAHPGPRPPRDSGTSARRPPSPPVHRNPANPAPAARQGRRTAAPHPATTWEKRRRGNSRSRHGANAQVKRQAKGSQIY